MWCNATGESSEETAALGYFITPCVGTLVTLICYLLLPRLVHIFVFPQTMALKCDLKISM